MILAFSRYHRHTCHQDEVCRRAAGPRELHGLGTRRVDTGIPVDLLSRGFWIFAVNVFLTLGTYMRPSGPLTMEKRDLIALVPGITEACHSKVVSDRAANTVQDVRGQRQWRTDGFRISLERSRLLLGRSLAVADLELAIPGAAPDASQRSCPRLDARGRWASDATINRYTQRARLAVLHLKLPTAVQNHLMATEHHIGDIVCGRKRPTDPARFGTRG